VIAFFVISGIVIAHATQGAHVTPRSYFLARASRVYSVALPAMLFALALDHIGMLFGPEIYREYYGYDRPWLRIAFHALFLGETWFGSSQPFSMAPYWSLGYEVWYYAWFGCVALLTGRARWLGAGAALLVMGPRIWLLLPTWWLGVLLYRRVARLNMHPAAAVALMLLAIAAYAAFVGSGARDLTDVASMRIFALFDSAAPWPFNPGEAAQVLSDYTVAALFAAFVIGCAHCGVAPGPRASRLIRTLAAYTFTFYLVHFSLLAFAKALGLAVFGWTDYAVLLAAVLAVTWALAQLGEQRRNVVRRLLARIWSGRPD
jgi:peptidoglycan/LPS O-acetylase OafA/YrhL